MKNGTKSVASADTNHSPSSKKNQSSSEALPVDELTWAALLAYWMDFARSAKASFRDRRGKLWQQSAPDIITLQALTLALKQLHKLPAAEQAIGLDRSEYQISLSVANLQDLWADEQMLPEALIEILRDAQAQSLHETLASAVVELVVVDLGSEEEDDDNDDNDDDDDESGGGILIVPDWREAAEDLDDAGFRGTLRLAEPGTVLVPGEPLGSIECDSEWMRAHDADETVEFITRMAALLEVLGPEVTLCSGTEVKHAQIYRMTEEQTGQLVRDVIRCMDDDPVAGRPLIVDVITPDQGGIDQAKMARMDADKWLQTQMRCWPHEDGATFEIDDQRVACDQS